MIPDIDSDFPELKTISLDKVKRTLPSVVRKNDHRRGLTYTDGAGNPVCLIGLFLARVLKLQPGEFTFPEELEMRAFDNEMLQDYLLIAWDLLFTDRAREALTDVQALVDTGMPWDLALYETAL